MLYIYLYIPLHTGSRLAYHQHRDSDKRPETFACCCLHSCVLVCGYATHLAYESRKAQASLVQPGVAALGSVCTHITAHKETGVERAN